MNDKAEPLNPENEKIMNDKLDEYIRSSERLSKMKKYRNRYGDTYYYEPVGEKSMTEDFWDWLPKAYGEVGDETVFTKYNMEVAFAAGAEAEAKRMWVGLTDEDLFDIASVNFGEPDLQLFIEMGRLVQEELKEKNT